MAYFDSGSAAEILDRQCTSCPFGEYQCPVYMAQSLFNCDQMMDGKRELKDCLTFLVDDAGICQVKKLMMQSCEDLVRRHRVIEQYAFLLKQFDKRIVAL